MLVFPHIHPHKQAIYSHIRTLNFHICLKNLSTSSINPHANQSTCTQATHRSNPLSQPPMHLPLCTIHPNTHPFTHSPSHQSIKLFLATYSKCNDQPQQGFSQQSSTHQYNLEIFTNSWLYLRTRMTGYAPIHDPNIRIWNGVGFWERLKCGSLRTGSFRAPLKSH